MLSLRHISWLLSDIDYFQLKILESTTAPTYIVASKWLSVSAVQAAVTQPVVVEKNSLLWSDTEYFPKWSGKHYVTRGSLSGGRDFSQSQVSLVQNRYIGVTGATATRYLGPSPSHHSYLCTTGSKIPNVLLLTSKLNIGMV